jgi:NADH-quinone oxidoreductase subunit L
MFGTTPLAIGSTLIGHGGAHQTTPTDPGLAPLIAGLPFLAFLIALAFGSRLPRGGAEAGILATAGSLVLSIVTLVQVNGGGSYRAVVYEWVAPGGDAIGFHAGVLIDPLAALMLTIVSLIAFLVHVFSLGYMNDEGETGLPRYYAGLGLFTFSMLAFVMAGNLLMAFAFFELVGLCSYLLIGFWFREEGPPSAAKKAFLVTRFGDYFFLIGVVAVFAAFRSAAFAGPDAFPGIAAERLASGAPILGLPPNLGILLIGGLVLGGVIGKSAQFPLHTWLPDAMEGPTPVSALIHAATMVAAGVYLVARMYGFYALSPELLAVVAFVGGFTALFAATMGVIKDEIKQVLAYSTISQYGYMMLALGAGGYVAAVFHLFTHAMFKALLFLGAGAVIIAMHHEEDMWEMGALRERMPVTYLTFLAGSLALAGIAPFAGFWSKDEVLYEALIHGLGGSQLLLAAYAMGLLAVLFTGFYTFRMVFLTFHGYPRSTTARDPHGVGWNVKLPLVVLGVLATVGGAANLKFVKELIGVKTLAGFDLELLHHFLDTGEGAGEAFAALSAHHYSQVLQDVAGYSSADVGVLVPGAVSLGLALLGALLAYRLYAVPEPARHTDRLGGLATLWRNNYYQDEYQVWLAEGLTLPIARTADLFDQGVIDGAVNAASSVSLFAGRRMRRLQTGVVTGYAGLLTLSFLALLLAFAYLGGWLP